MIAENNHFDSTKIRIKYKISENIPFDSMKIRIKYKIDNINLK